MKPEHITCLAFPGAGLRPDSQGGSKRLQRQEGVHEVPELWQRPSAWRSPPPSPGPVSAAAAPDRSTEVIPDTYQQAECDGGYDVWQINVVTLHLATYHNSSGG